MDAIPRCYHVVLHRLTNEEIRQHMRKKTNLSKTAKSSQKNKNKNKTYKYSTLKRRSPRKTMPSVVNKNIVEHSAHSTKYQSSKAMMPRYVNKNKTAEDSAHISKHQNARTPTLRYVNKTGEDSVHISKQQSSGKAISRCVIDGTAENSVMIAPKAILKRRKSDSIVETRQNSTKQDNNSCDSQRTSKRQRIKNDYFVKTHNNNAENITVSHRKRKSDSEFETQSRLRSISNQCLEILPKKRRQETSVCDNTSINITNTKVTTAPKFIKSQNQLSCNQSVTSKNKHTDKETLNGTIDNSEILQNERVETYSEMQENQSPFSKNIEVDNEDIAVVYDNLSTEDRNLNVQPHDILNSNHERSTTDQSEINNASRKNAHDEKENSRKLLNSMPVYNTNKMYFKTFTAAYGNSLRKNTLFQITNLYRLTHISELDFSSSFPYGYQFSSHLTNKIDSNIRLPIDTSEYRFDTICDLNEKFLFNLIAAEDNDKLKLDNLQNIECVIYYSCKSNKKLISVPRTKTNFAGRVILTSDTKHLIKYPAYLKKYLLNANKREFPHLNRNSIDKDVGDIIRPSNEADVYFILHEMIQGISKKYEKQKHWYHCKCCFSPFSTYNELEPICPSCNIYCTLDFHIKRFDSEGFPKRNGRRSFISRKIKRICTNNTTNILKLDKKGLEKELFLDSNEKNVTSGKYSAKILTTVEDELIHKTPVNLETFENSSVTNPINNTRLHLMNGSPVTDRQESQQKLLVEDTDEGEDANTGAELIMLDTSEGCGEHETYLLLAVENDGMPEQKSQDLQVLENLESEITDEKDRCEEQDDAISLKSAQSIQFENTMLLSLDAEPQVQDNDNSNIQFILLDGSNSGEISSAVEVTVADDEQNLSKNNSVPSCTSQSIGTTSISAPDSSEIQIIEYTSFCQSSADTPNLPLTTNDSDVSKDLSQNSVVPTCISNPNSPEIQITDAIIKPIKSFSDTGNPKLRSPIIDESEKNLSKKSPIPSCISYPDSSEIQIIEETPIKSPKDTDNPKLYSTTIDELEENLSKKSPTHTCISLPEIEIIEDRSVYLSSNATSNPKLPSDTTDRTEKNVSENSSKPTCILQSDSSEIRIIECTSLSQSMDIPNLPSTTTDVSDDLSENLSLPTDMPNLLATTTDVSYDLSENSSLSMDMPNLLATTTDVSDDLSENSSLPTDMPNLLATIADVSDDLSENSLLPTDMPNLLSTTTDVSDDLSENSSLPTDMPNLLSTTTDVSDVLSENLSLPTDISRCFAVKIQIIEYNSVCKSSDAQDPKLLTTDESVLKVPVVIDSIEMPSNMEDNFVNNEGHLSGNSLEPICNSLSSVCPKIKILEYNSLCQSDPKSLKSQKNTEESEENLSENSQMTTRISQSDASKIQILNYNSTCESSRDIQDPKLPTANESVLKTPVIIYSGEMLSNTEDNFVNNEELLSENSAEPICNSQSDASKIQILNYNSICESSSDIQDPKLPTAGESVLKTPVIIYSGEIPSNIDNNFVNNEEPLSENSPEPICNSQSITSKIQILEYSSLCQSDPKIFSNTTEESEEKLPENSQMPTRISQPVSSKVQILECNSIFSSSSDIHNPKSPNPTATTDYSNLNRPVIQSVKSLTDTINSTNELLGNSAIPDKIIVSCTLPTSSVTDTSTNSIEEATLEEEVQRKAVENANSALEREFCDINDNKDHSESNFISDSDNYMNDCNSENSLQLSMERESIEHDAKKDDDFIREEVSLGEKVQIKNADSNCTHEKNVCKFSDTKDHSEPNFTSDRNSYMNDCHSENSLQLSMERESIEHDAKKDDDFIGEEVSLGEKVQIKNADSNCTHEKNVCEFRDTKDYCEQNFVSDRNSYMNDCHSENSLEVSVDAGELTGRDTPKSNSISHEFLSSQNSNNLSLKTEKKGDDYTQTLLTTSVNESSISCTEEIPLEEEVKRKTVENSNCVLEKDFSDPKDHYESNFISDRDSYLNDCNSANSLQVCIDIEESTKVIPESNSLSHELLNSQKANKDEDDYTHSVQTASVNDSSISSSKDVSVGKEVQRQTTENSNFSLERGFCNVSDTKNHNESNFTSGKDSYMNDCNSENSLQLSRDTGESTEHDVPEANSVSHEFLNYPNSNDLPLKKRKKYFDVSDCSVSSTEELSLEENMQRKNSENSYCTPERYFCDFNDVKHHNECNSKQNTEVTSSNFVYVDEDFPTVFLKYMRVLEDLLPQEIVSVKRSNADGSENAYLTHEMLGIASTIASLDILNDYSKVSKFIDFVSKWIYYLENHENSDESEILKIKYFLKKLYVINDFIEKYGTYDKLVEDLLKNDGKISVWDSNRDGTKEGNLVRYSNTDPKLSKKKLLLETKDDPSTKGTTSNICDTYLELLNNPAFLADVSQQTSSKHKNRYVKFCAVINCKACNMYSDRNEDKLETIAKAPEVYDESNALMSSEPPKNKGLKLEKCIKEIKNMNEPISSGVSPISSKNQLISAFQDMSATNKSNTLSSTSESDFEATLTSPSKTIAYDSISPVHGEPFSTVSKTVSTFTENQVGTDSAHLNNSSCLLDYSRVVEALTIERNYESSQNRLSPKTLINKVLKEKRPYRKRSHNTIKEKRTYRKRNVKPTQEQLPVSTSSISSLSQSIDTSVVGFKTKGNALADPSIPLCNQNESLYVSQEQQPASANPSIPLYNQNPSQGQQYPLANPPVPLCNHGAICMDQRQSLNASQASGNMHHCKTNPHFDYRMSSYSSLSQVPWHTPLAQSSSVQGVPHITCASSTSDALVRSNLSQTDFSSLSRCSVQTSVTTRTDISFETQHTSSLRHLANFGSESRSSNASRGEFSNYEKNIQNTWTSTGSRAVPYPPQYMPRYPETFSQRPPLYSSRTLSSTSQPSSQSMYPGHHTYPYQCYPSMPHSSSTLTQSTPNIPPSSYTQSSYSSSQSTPNIPPSSHTQSSYSSSQSTPIVPHSSYTQSSYSSSQSTPIIPPPSYTQSSSSQSTPIIPPSSYTQSSYSSSQSTPIPSPSYMQSSYSSFQPSPSLQRTPYPSPWMQLSSSDPRTLPYLHQMNLPHAHSAYK